MAASIATESVAWWVATVGAVEVAKAWIVAKTVHAIHAVHAIDAAAKLWKVVEPVDWIHLLDWRQALEGWNAESGWRRAVRTDASNSDSADADASVALIRVRLEAVGNGVSLVAAEETGSFVRVDDTVSIGVQLLVGLRSRDALEVAGFLERL